MTALSVNLFSRKGWFELFGTRYKIIPMHFCTSEVPERHKDCTYKELYLYEKKGKNALKSNLYNSLIVSALSFCILPKQPPFKHMEDHSF